MKNRAPLLRALIAIMFFLITASIATVLIGNYNYLFLFGGIGVLAGITEYTIAVNPKKSQYIRKSVNIILGTALVTLAIMISINFQFSQVCFDLYSGVISGAIIQLCVARFFLPLLFGNIFCSRVCWDGAAFEISDLNRNSPSQNTSKLLAWSFMAIIVFSTFLISLTHLPKTGTNTMRNIFIMENAAIILFGLVISCFAGKRFYCRHLCPFLAISGLISKYSLFKITPDKNSKCISCQECNKGCPMGIDVMDYVRKEKRIAHPNCILCENCVSVCKSRCLALNIKS